MLKADPENGLPVLLCHCTKEDHFPAIRNWADGPSWYEQTKRCLHGSASAEQVALTVTVLLYYDWFAGTGNKTLAITSYYHLIAFVQKQMAGKGLGNRREVWRGMAGSIQELLGEEYMPRSSMDGMFTEEPQLHWPNGLVDMYQICAGGDGWVLEEEG